MMSNGAAVADADRLPWLEPHRETAKSRAPRPRRRPLGQSWLGAAAVVTLLAAAAGGYWLGLNDTSDPLVAAPGEPARTATVPLPEPAPLAIPARPAEAEPNAAPPVIEPAAESARQAVARPVKKKAKRRYRARAKIRNAGIEQERLDAIRSQQETAAPVTAPPRVWPRLPSPGPAGQVIQLGAFTHPDRAYRAYNARLARYPALGRMPRVIVPIAPRSNGKIYYALRLGTASRQQSKTVCRNLRRSGDHCLVIG